MNAKIPPFSMKVLKALAKINGPSIDDQQPAVAAEVAQALGVKVQQVNGALATLEPVYVSWDQNGDKSEWLIYVTEDGLKAAQESSKADWTADDLLMAMW